VDAVLLIQHGSVEDPAEIPEFVRTIRRGRPTPQSIVDEVTHRWNAIGGSPLLAITHEQARALSQRLGTRVAVGSRLWKPWARDVVAELARAGVTRVLSLPLAPMSVHVYNPTTREACAAAGVTCVEVPAWHDEPALIDAFASVTRAAMVDGAHVLFTAHSLPTRVIAAGDPYEAQVKRTAQLVAAAMSASDWSVAFQSQGMDGGDWLGPDLKAAFASLAERGVRDVVVCAIGFLADHTEVLYDLDIEAKQLAEQNGLRFHRASSLNAHPRLIDALESVARRALIQPSCPE
jgi:ferrochelatase